MGIKTTLFIIASIFLISNVYGQRGCANGPYMEHLYQSNPALLKQTEDLNKAISTQILRKKNARISGVSSVEEVYNIPVVVHIIHNVQSGNLINGNITEAQIVSQIEVLNKDFGKKNSDTIDTHPSFISLAADTKINFCLASIDPEGNPTNGIVRVYNKKTTYTEYDGEAIQALSSWPSDEYLNIWVCTLANSVLGFAQFPNNSTQSGLSAYMGDTGTDGVVVDYHYFGDINTLNPYDKGRTTTHEVGHWLGLLHIFGSGGCDDDYVTDTPIQQGYNDDILCNDQYSNCAGPSTLDMSQNYMDYTGDACMNIFTIGQKERMRAVMEISPRRNKLLYSIGCCPYEARFSMPYKVDFETTTYLEDQWEIINPDHASSYSRQWETFDGGAYGKSAKCIRIQNDSVYSATKINYWDAIESSYFDLSLVPKPVLDFDLAYARNTITSETDSLVVFYREGCNGKWNAIKSFYGDELVSTARIDNSFIPESKDWKRLRVDIASLSGKKFVKFRIAVFSKGVNKLYLDNINLYNEYNGFFFDLFPVPSSQSVNVRMEFNGYQDIQLEAYDMQGRRVLKRDFIESSSTVESIDISNLRAGLYIFKLYSEFGKFSKKVVVY